MKKLFTLMTAALCTANVMAAGDGNIVKYDFENYKKEGSDKYYTWYELDADNNEQKIWGTGNSGYALAKLLSGGAKEGDFPTEVEENGRTGACVKLETKDTYTMFSKKTPIAAGNLFFGSFNLDISNPLASTKFGISYDKKPLSFSFYYKYQAGAKLQDIDRKEVTGKTDKGNAYAVIYDNVNGSFQADGSNILDNENIVGIANAGELDNAAEWTYKNVTFDYTKEIDKDKLAAGGYSLALVFTASIKGDAFEGAIGSVMYVDDVELVCESEVVPVSPKTFTDNLQVTLDGNPLEPQQASIFVTDKGDGKYTLSLPNFVLGTGADQIAVGTITIEDVEGIETDGVIKLSTTQTITIKDGDLEGVDGWIGQALGEVPVTLNAEMTDDKLYAEIDIPFGIMSIKVVFGKVNTAVAGVSADMQQTTGIYTIGGAKVDAMQSGNVYIIRKADGKTVKLMK